MFDLKIRHKTRLIVLMIATILTVLLINRETLVSTLYLLGVRSPYQISRPVLLSSPAFAASLPPSQTSPLPVDAGYVNVKDLGAKGDGITDDTAVLKQVFGRNKEDPGGAIRSIYLPDGIYLVSDTLDWGDKRKDVRGQSRDGVIIKLKDNCPGFQNASQPQKVLQIEFGHGGQNFNQRLRNLTVDVGQGNPGAIGIGFHTNNGGGIYDVIVRSSDPEKRGHIGLSLDKEWPGPGLIKNVQIDGFDTGIFITHDQYSMTFEHIWLTNQRRVGFVNDWNTVAIRDLKSMNRVPAIENLGAMGLMVLIESELRGGDPAVPAIINHQDGVLFAREIQTEGYGVSIENRSGRTQQITNSRVEEFVSHEVSHQFPGSTRSLHLPVKEPPDIAYGDPLEWANVIQFGAIPDDEQDDSEAIQKAIDSGAKTVYFPVGIYQTQKSLKVHGTVARIIGFNAAMIVTTAEQPAFMVEDGIPEAVSIEIESTYGSQHNYWIQHSSTRTLFIKGGSYINTVPGGNVFFEDTVSVPLVFNQQHVWMRQMNTESYDHNPHIVNNGSDVWILGLKTEKDRTIIGTSQNGRTEVLGGLLYKNREQLGDVPAFISDNSAISLVYRNKGEAYQVQVLEKRNDITQEFTVQEMPASNWRMPLYVGY